MRFAILSVAAAAGLALSADTASAQPGWGYGGYRGGFYGQPAYGSSFSFGITTPRGLSFSFGNSSFSPYRGGYGYGSGYGYPGYGYGSGYRNPGFGYGYPGYGYPGYGYRRW